MAGEIEGAPDSGRAAWNINGQYAMMIAARLAKAQEYLDDNNMVKYFGILNSVYELTTHNLEDNVIEDMDKIRYNVQRNEKFFIGVSNKMNVGLGKEVTTDYRKGSWRYCEYIKRFNRALLKILKQCGYLTNTAMRSHLKL